jgi:hypothetical protein
VRRRAPGISNSRIRESLSALQHPPPMGLQERHPSLGHNGPGLGGRGETFPLAQPLYQVLCPAVGPRRQLPYPDFHDSLRGFPFKESEAQAYLTGGDYKIDLESFAKTISLEERICRFEALDFVPFEGRVDLKNPSVTFSLIEFWGLDHNNLPPDPLQVFFGPQIGEGQRHLLRRFSIKSRKLSATPRWIRCWPFSWPT